MTLTIAPAAWATSTTAAMSASTSASRPDLSAPIWMTMSSSVAPSASARRASNTLVSVRWLPCGKPMTVPTATSVPAEDGAGRRRRPAGRRPTRRRIRRPAGSRPRRTHRPARVAAANGRWSWRCRARSGCRWKGHGAHLMYGRRTSRATQEAALDQVVGPLEVPVLVLDDDVAVVAGAVQRGEERRPVDVAEAGQARDLPADADRERRRARRGRRGRSSGPWPGRGGCAARTRG